MDQQSDMTIPSIEEIIASREEAEEADRKRRAQEQTEISGRHAERDAIAEVGRRVRGN